MRKYIRYTLLIVILIIVIASGWLVVDFGSSLQKVYKNAQLAGEYFYYGTAYAASAIKTASPNLGSSYFNDAEKYFIAAEEELNSSSFLKNFPLINTETRNINQIMMSGRILSRNAFNLTRLAEEIMVAIPVDQRANLNEINPATRRLILKKLHEAQPMLYGAKADLDLALINLRASRHGLVYALIRERVDQVQEKLILLDQLLDDALPILELFPRLAGYPEAKTYLFLLENNTELRPTGGFIGTYGLVTLKDGQIDKFWTDDSYNLDKQVKAKTRPDAPAVLQKYLGIKKWYFRDVNWSPDFKEAAKLALQFYQEESGSKEKIDGVIAVTPEIMVELLKIIGPVKIETQTFTAEDFVDALEWQVEQGYLEQGIPKPQRKAIISILAKQLTDQLHQLPLEQWPLIIHTARTLLEEKQILIYTDDSDLQKFVDGQSWGGRMEGATGDYLTVIDANLASLKTDRVVKRAIDYGVQMVGDDLVANLKIIYKNQAKSFDWRTSRYRTYTRVYVPLGSKLLEVRGAMVKEKDSRPGEVEAYEEFGKTVFGAFIVIEPGKEGVLEFKYRLPKFIGQQVEQNMYSLFFQKQAGIQVSDLTISLDLGKKIKAWSPWGLGVEARNSQIKWQNPVRQDTEFKVQF